MSKSRKPKTLNQAVERLLHKRRGLHPKCNHQNYLSKMCGCEAVKWYIFEFLGHNPYILYGESRCSRHAYQLSYPNTMIFLSLDEIRVWQVMCT
jgi:hypothetical protein